MKAPTTKRRRCGAQSKIHTSWYSAFFFFKTTNQNSLKYYECVSFCVIIHSASKLEHSIRTVKGGGYILKHTNEKVEGNKYLATLGFTFP